jgi:phospholipid-binding lipoprotein MlaA
VVPVHNNDFGQTLGRWGMGEGAYLVLPLLGPSNLRDTLGLAGDYGINVLTSPFTYMSDTPYLLDLGLSGARILNNSGDLVRGYDALKSIAIDPYSAMRDGYTVRRRAEIAR